MLDRDVGGGRISESEVSDQMKEFWTRPGSLAGGFAEMRLPERRKWAELRATR